MFAAMSGLYTVMVIAFPVSSRVASVGVVSTAGRIGAVLGPLGAGLLIESDITPQMLCVILGLPALLAAAVLFVQGLSFSNGRTV
jgi:hypothetical protein